MPHLFAVTLGLILLAACSRPASDGPPRRATAATPEEGYVTTEDGARLFYVKAGAGSDTIILPARLFTYRDLGPLADEFTLIAYDMRNRGRSSFVQDNTRLTIQDDVRDLEAIRSHFGVERFHAIGYSYLGMMVILYASAHPDRVERVVQIGPVPRAFGTEYPGDLTTPDNLDPDGVARLREMRDRNLHLTDPEAYCREEWKVTSVRLVGDAADVGKVDYDVCDMPNEWPSNLVRHFTHQFASVQELTITDDQVGRVRQPVLTIHGTLDRNAPYGSGREWAMMLPDARLLTVEGAAHGVCAERPDVVLPAIREFLHGRWPAAAEKVVSLEPAVGS